MFENIFCEKKEIKRCSLIVGCVLLLSYFLEQILSTVIVLVYNLLGYSSEEIEKVFLDPWSGYLFNTIIVSIICILPFLLLKFVNRKPVYEIAVFKAPSKGSIILCIGFAFGFSMIANIATSLFNLFLSTFFGFNATTSSLGSNKSGDLLEFIFILICSSVIPALVEEFAFRGMVLGTLRRFGDLPAIVISALVFAVFHGNFVQIPFAFIVGIVLGLITVINNSIWPAIISHFLINAYANVVNELSSDFPVIVAILLYFIVAIGVICLVSLFLKGEFKKVNNKIIFVPLASKVLYMILAPTTIIFILIMLYNALQYKV